MRFKYSVSFEHDLKPVKTHRGEVKASNPATCFARAVRKAHKELKPGRWRSIVCVLELLEDEDAEKV